VVLTARNYTCRERKCADTVLAQCRFPGLDNHFCSDKILIHFSDKIYGSNFIKQHSETVMLIALLKIIVLLIIIFSTLSFYD